MEIKYFTETYDPQYGGVYDVTDCGIMTKAERMENVQIEDPSNTIGYMEDYKEDEAAKEFIESVNRAEKVIAYFNDASYPGKISTIYQIIIK